MLEALWSVEFISNVGGTGGGVVVLETQRLFGGDSQYFYVGTFKVEGPLVRATLKVTHYYGPPSSVFGPISEFNSNC